VLDSRTKAREILSWSSIPLQSTFASCPPVSPSPHRPACANRLVPGTRVRLSWGSCSHERNYVGCPFSPLRSFPTASVDEGNCHPLVGAVLRVLAPLDGSGNARGTARTPCGARRYAVAPRRFAALFHAARVPMELPFRAFPSRGAVPALAGLLLPCEFGLYRPPPARLWERASRSLSTVAPALCLAAHPEVNRDA